MLLWSVRRRLLLSGIPANNNYLLRNTLNRAFTSENKNNTNHPKKEEDIISAPGAPVGQVATPFQHAVGLERLELLAKLSGATPASIYASTTSPIHSKGETFKGTPTDPLIIESLAGSEGAEGRMIVGCSGVPRGSHEINFLWVESETKTDRCPECGQAFRLKLVHP